jgi:succinyl-diaminopimelate desuccinylase
MQYFSSLQLSQELIKIPSYSGYNQQILLLIDNYLNNLGFSCSHLDFDGDNSYKVNNLHAIYNPQQHQKTLYFAGHTDVVKEGKLQDWLYPPFSAKVFQEKLYGRGASDMKCAIACFMVAISKFLKQYPNPNFGIGFLITNDEENDSINGTKKVLDWMKSKQHNITYCLVGEPTNPTKFGEVIKIGRRGSVSFNLKIIGKQGHVAYPDIALNPITIAFNLAKILKDHYLDNGNQFFDKSNLEFTSFVSQNLGSNVIVNEVDLAFNVRFNNAHTGKQIVELVQYVCAKTISPATYFLQHKISGEAFLSSPQFLAEITKQSCFEITNLKTEFSTSGGTSDARFIKDYAQEVVEIGLINETAHKINEFANIYEIEQLTKVYYNILLKIQSSSEKTYS